MHAVVRNYSGKGAEALFDVLDQRKADVEKLMRGVPGFRSYTLFRTADGGVSVTVRSDRKGAEASVRTAADWVRQNAGGTGAKAPQISEGAVIVHVG
jgi:hypothetical protein